MLKQFVFLSMTLSLLLTACNEDAVNPTPSADTSDLTTSEELATVTYLDSELQDALDELTGTRDPGDPCAEVSFVNEPGTFPNTVTIDFGEGCEGPRGHIRSGMIIVEQTAPMNQPGATRTVNFKNFSIDDIAIEGTRTRTNLSNGEGTIVVFNHENQYTLTFPSGATATHTNTWTREQIAGIETDDRMDDIFQITGSSSGTNRLGVTYTAEITSALIKARTCRWISQGVVTVTTDSEDGPLTRTIDYGYPAGECDNRAMVTLADGTEIKIRINRRWW